MKQMKPLFKVGVWMLVAAFTIAFIASASGQETTGIKWVYFIAIVLFIGGIASAIIGGIRSWKMDD